VVVIHSGVDGGSCDYLWLWWRWCWLVLVLSVVVIDRSGDWKCWEPHPPGDVRVCPGLYSDILKFIYFNHVFQTVTINMHATKCDRDWE